MNILITNDDGFDAPGLSAAFDAVSQLGRVLLVAPSGERSHTLMIDWCSVPPVQYACSSSSNRAQPRSTPVRTATWASTDA